MKPIHLLVSAILASALSAQGDFHFGKASAATFGNNLKLDYTGAPASKPMMFMLSNTGGPIPLKLMFAGTDPRSIQVGVDLLPIWILIGTTPSGNGSIQVQVPNQAFLQGIHLHLQLMTGGGPGPNIIDKISDKVVIVPGAPGTTDTLASQLGDGRTPVGTGRALMSVSDIGDGNVFLAGGGTGNILGAQGLKTTEIFDFDTMTSGPGPDLSVERALHSATVLQDGRVLIVGGVDGGSSTTSGNPLATCEIYDPTTNQITPTGSMAEARAGHAATLLNDGRVLVVAGTKELSDVTKVLTGILNSAEIYNPTTGTWSAAAPIAERVIGPALTTLSNGRVLVSGGAKINTVFSIPTSVGSVSTCQLYNPGTNTWSNTGSMKQHRSVHTFNTIRLADGRVLVTGGVVVSIPLIPIPSNFAGATATDKCEFYDPNTGAWTSLPTLAEARFGHSANQLPNGKVLVCGGGKGAIDTSVSIASIQEFDPTSNTFVRTFALKTGRGTHGATVLPDANLVIFGGVTSATATATLRSIEIVHQ